MSYFDPTDVKEHLDFVRNLLIGVLIVAALAIVGFVIAYFTEVIASNKELKNEIIKQNTKIEMLFQQCVGVGQGSVAPIQIQVGHPSEIIQSATQSPTKY